MADIIDTVTETGKELLEDVKAKKKEAEEKKKKERKTCKYINLTTLSYHFFSCE